jgi:hypothetical protein
MLRHEAAVLRRQGARLLLHRPPMAHLWRIPSRSHSSVSVRITPLICRDCSSPFAIVRIGRICKQGVGISDTPT